MFPHDLLLDVFNKYLPEKVGSLGFRFYHENLLLTHANDKIYFGWGLWGRNRLVDSITDGFWIIKLGMFGLIGFLAYFGLIGSTILKAALLQTKLKEGLEQKMVLGHAFIISIILIDQLPNHTLYSWGMFFIGALSGRTLYIKTNTTPDKYRTSL
jgi:hypothetical protein